MLDATGHGGPGYELVEAGRGMPGYEDVEVLDIVDDSRRVSPGSLFVSVPSVGGDALSGGAGHVGEAAAAGAVAVLAQAGVPVSGTTDIRVPDVRAALADLSAEFFGHPSHELKVFGVTGTDGKTTTSFLLEQILSDAGFRTGLMGTVEIKVGDERLPNSDRLTTPESVDVQRLLRRMVDAGVTHAVVEASSHALALQRLRGCKFTASALTNITGDHVEFHGSFDAYFAAKASLFTELGKGAPAVLNRDDSSYQRLAPTVEGLVYAYGLSAEAAVRAADVEHDEFSSRFRLLYRRPTASGHGGPGHGGTMRAGDTLAANGSADGEVLVHLPLPGVYNVHNALAAAGLAIVAGVPLEIIAQALGHATPPPGRMQRVDRGQPFEVIVDYAHTPNAFQFVLQAERKRTNGRVIAVFGCAGTRDRGKRPVMGRICHDYADYFYVTMEDPYTEPAEQIMADVVASLPVAEEGTRYERVRERKDAIDLAIRQARPGDTVLILGKGHEPTIVENGHKMPWSDVEAARGALERRV